MTKIEHLADLHGRNTCSKQGFSLIIMEENRHIKKPTYWKNKSPKTIMKPKNIQK